MAHSGLKYIEREFTQILKQNEQCEICFKSDFKDTKVMHQWYLIKRPFSFQKSFRDMFLHTRTLSISIQNPELSLHLSPFQKKVVYFVASTWCFFVAVLLP